MYILQQPSSLTSTSDLSTCSNKRFFMESKINRNSLQLSVPEQQHPIFARLWRFSQLIRYARATSSHECFILRTVRLSNKLLGQGYVKERLRSSLRKFYGRYGDFIQQYEVPLSRMLHDMDDDHLQ